MRNYKTKTTMMILGMLTASASFAQTTRNPISNEIAATHDFVDAVVNKVDGQITGNSIHSADYERVKAGFRAKVRSALTQFEADMNQKLFQPLSVYVDEYNRTYNDHTRSDSEKAAQLKAKLTVMQNMMSLYQQQYDDFLVALYSIEPSLRIKGFNFAGGIVQYEPGSYDSTLKCDVIFMDNSVVVLPLVRANNSLHRYAAKEGATRWAIAMQSKPSLKYIPTFSPHAYQVIVDSCSVAAPQNIPSQYCINSSIGDQLEYFLSVQAALDRSIEVKLADGKEIALSPLANQLHTLTIRSLQTIKLDPTFKNYPFTN